MPDIPAPIIAILFTVLILIIIYAFEIQIGFSHKHCLVLLIKPIEIIFGFF